MNDDPGSYEHFYSDVGYFTRGRSGYHPEPVVAEKRDAWWAVIAFAIVASIVIGVHALMPGVS